MFISHKPKLRYMVTLSWKPSRTGKTQILPYLQANKLACHNFMDAGRRYGAPGPETKDFITYSTAGSVSFMFAVTSLALTLNPTRAT